MTTHSVVLQLCSRINCSTSSLELDELIHCVTFPCLIAEVQTNYLITVIDYMHETWYKGLWVIKTWKPRFWKPIPVCQPQLYSNEKYKVTCGPAAHQSSVGHLRMACIQPPCSWFSMYHKLYATCIQLGLADDNNCILHAEHAHIAHLLLSTPDDAPIVSFWRTNAA